MTTFAALARGPCSTCPLATDAPSGSRQNSTFWQIVSQNADLLHFYIFAHNLASRIGATGAASFVIPLQLPLAEFSSSMIAAHFQIYIPINNKKSRTSKHPHDFSSLSNFICFIAKFQMGKERGEAETASPSYIIS